MSTLVKVCGLRRVRDAELAIELGASFVGCVLATDSPRCATLAEATAIAECARQSAARAVLVFRDASLAEVDAAITATKARHVQLHGKQAAEVAAELGQRGLHVLRVVALAAAAAAQHAHHSPKLARPRGLPALPAASAEAPVVLDHGRGGTGRSFDWARLGRRAPRHCLVAGGVRADKLASLMPRAPWGIDVSSGVECAPGIKDAQQLRELFAALRALEPVRSR